MNRQGQERRGGTLPGGVAAVVLAALVCGTAANLLSPRRIPWVEDWANYIETKALKEKVTLVTAEQAHRLFEQGTHFFLDARTAEDFRAGHIPTAISLPYLDLDTAISEAQQYLSPAQPLVTYCSGKDCDESFLLTVYLRQQGFTNIVLFAGGMDQWRASGYPVEGGAP